MDQLSNSELDLALKINRHKVFVSRFVIFCLFFIDLLVMYNLWYRWVLYTSSIRAAGNEQPMPKLQIDFQGYHARHQPATIAIQQKGSLIAGDKLDHYVMIQNPNTEWQARSLTVEFRFPNETIRQVITNLTPQETRLVAVYGFPKTSGVAFIVTVSNTQWKRVNYSLPNISSTLRIEHPKYESNGFLQNYGESVFTIVNTSTKGYWNIPYAIKLYSGTQLAGITSLSLANLDPEERREIKTAWNINPNLITNVEVSIEPWSLIDEQNWYITRENTQPSSGLTR